MTKTHSPAAFVRGDQGTYTVTVTNTGDAATGPVRFDDILPGGLSIVSMSGADWECQPALRRCDYNAGAGAGQQLPPVTVVVEVAADAPCAGVTNTARVRADALDVQANDATPITGAGC
ncbi:hypothetical protein ADK75_19440, partial [Streptomyces virginiae]